MPHTRRVSFSERLSYSDEGDDTTVTTDDELYQDDASFSNSDDDEDDYASAEDDDTVDSGSDDEELEDGSEDEEGPEVEGEEDVDSDDEEACDDEDDEEASDEEQEDLDSDDTEVSQDEESERCEDEEPAGVDSEEVLKGDSAKAEEYDSSKEEEKKDSSEPYYVPVKDEPPLTFRDAGVTYRPDEYLGGYGPESSCAPTQRVKLRKSWVADAKEEKEDHTDHQEFEAWKNARAAEVAARKAKTMATAAAKKEANRKLEPAEIADKSESINTDSTSVITDSEETNENGVALNDPKPESTAIPKSKALRTDNTQVKPKPVSLMKSKPSPETKVMQAEEPKASKMATATVKKSKSDLKKKKTKSEKAKRGSKKDLKLKAAKPVMKAKVKDPETLAHEKEVLEMKEHIAKLQRNLDTIEVRTISQLADLEEDTTKRMREYRAKADEIVRKQKAKNEKQALKQKQMKSQDVIEQLRRSNQKLRAESTKIKAAMDGLKESNQVLEEKNSVHRGYAAEFLAFQKVEVGLAEAMNATLSKDMPKYEKLVRSMEDGCVDRVKSGHIERNAKELYEDCIDSMIEMLEVNSTDDTLLDRIGSLMDDESDEDTVATVEQSASIRENRTSLTASGKRSSLKDKKGDTSGVKTTSTTPKKSSIKRTSKSSLADQDSPGGGVSPAKSSIRRSSSISGGLKKSTKDGTVKQVKRRSSSRDSFRGTRAPRKSSLKMKPVTDSDDSSTCSLTSMTSATSGNFSITDYAY